MLKSVQTVIDRYDFNVISDLSKSDFTNLISDILEEYTKSEEFEKIAIQHLLTKMAKNLGQK